MKRKLMIKMKPQYSVAMTNGGSCTLGDNEKGYRLTIKYHKEISFPDKMLIYEDSIFYADELGYQYKGRGKVVAEARVDIIDVCDSGNGTQTGTAIIRIEKVFKPEKDFFDFYEEKTKSFKELDAELCQHCSATDWGEKAFISTPNGPIMCEGSYCDDAYEAYLESCALEEPPDNLIIVLDKED